MKDPRATRWLIRADGIAARLRAARGSASQADFARQLGWAASKVTRIEQGIQVPKPSDVRAWAEQAALDRPATDQLLAMLDEFHSLRSSWRDRVRAEGGQAGVQQEYHDLTAQASLIRHFQTAWVPGILQTEAYARAVLEQTAELYDADLDVEAALAVRLQRRELLYDGGRAFEFLIAEPVLRWLFVPPEIMRAQLHRLIDAIDLPRVKLGIVPMGRPIELAPQSSFVLYDDVLVAEHFGGEIRATGPDVALYEEVIGRLWRSARTGPSARDLLLAAIDAIARADG